MSRPAHQVKTVRVIAEAQFQNLLKDRQSLMELRNQPFQKELEKLKSLQTAILLDPDLSESEKAHRYQMGLLRIEKANRQMESLLKAKIPSLITTTPVTTTTTTTPPAKKKKKIMTPAEEKHQPLLLKTPIKKKKKKKNSIIITTTNNNDSISTPPPPPPPDIEIEPVFISPQQQQIPADIDNNNNNNDIQSILEDLPKKNRAKANRILLAIVNAGGRIHSAANQFTLHSKTYSNLRENLNLLINPVLQLGMIPPGTVYPKTRTNS